MQLEDTIAAISTPLGEGGIGIVRISGPESFTIAKKIFRRPEQNQLFIPRPRRLYYGHIRDNEGSCVDEVLASFMPAPHTYTREDIVEINCHSGIFALRSILKLILAAGARLAEPGEFTKRAFLSGRIDLSQAEAVINLIRARSEEAVKIAARALQGELLRQVEEIRKHIISIRAPLEASFDYPEEFEPVDAGINSGSIRQALEDLLYSNRQLLEGVEQSRAYQEGVSIAIIGRPNVGKSSLLNALLRQQRAIVHELPGTTRDLLEGYMNLGGYPLRLIDTAGIQGTSDPVEREGIERSRFAAAQAKLLIAVFDGSKKWTAADQAIADIKSSGQGLVIVVNKKDLDQKVLFDWLKEKFPEAEIVRTAAIKGEGIKDLEEAAARQLDKIFGSQLETTVVVAIRHEEIVIDAIQHLQNALADLDAQPIELISLELDSAWHKLGEITGDTVSEALLDKIFSDFCLGK